MNTIESCCKRSGRYTVITPVSLILLYGRVRKGRLTKCIGHATICDKYINETTTKRPINGMHLCYASSDSDTTVDMLQVGKGYSDHAIIQGCGHKTAIGAIDRGQNVTDCPLFE